MAKSKYASDIRKEAESFIVCDWNPVMGNFRLTLAWSCTYTVSLSRPQLAALHRVIGYELKKKRVKL